MVMKKNTVTIKKGLLWDVYEEACQKKTFQEDVHQRELLQSFQDLYDELEAPRLFPLPFKRAPKGLYIWGAVGRGKTFLMDLFFNQITRTPKRRVHFHEFMREVHARLHHKTESQQGALPQLVKEIANSTKLLCFDEFQVTNIADAMVMARLFEELLKQGVVVVATSNASPERLYEKGLHRERFLPFISLLLKHVTVFHLQGDIDYRRLKLSGHPRYFTPCNPETRNHLQCLWSHFTEQAPLEGVLFEREGPSLALEGLAKGVAWGSFQELCVRPCGRGEYLALADAIHTLILWGIPKMTLEDNNEAARFTTLIDILYDKGVCLVAAADAAPEHLYQQEGVFARTVSRLYEMQHD